MGCGERWRQVDRGRPEGRQGEEPKARSECLERKRQADTPGRETGNRKNTNNESLRGSRSPEEQDRKEGGNKEEHRQMQKRSLHVDAGTSGWRGKREGKKGNASK